MADSQTSSPTPDAGGEAEDDLTLAEVMGAVDALDTADPDWQNLQWHVADTLHDRFLEDGDPADLDAAIDRGRLVTTAQRETSAAHLHDLALMLWDRFEARHQTDDLSEYVRLLERALGILGDGGEDPELAAKCQANLASGLMSARRYDADGSARARAVELWEAALASGTLDDDVAAGVAANLAQALASPHADEPALRRAVVWGRLAVNTSTGDPEADAQNEFSLASALASLHEVVADEGLLEKAIAHVRSGLAHLGAGHPDAPGFSANLIGFLRQLARETDVPEPLDEAVTLARRTMSVTEDADPDRVLILTNAGAALLDASVRGNDESLLHEALDTYREAVRLAATGSTERGVALINFASASRDAQERLGDSSLTESAITASREALAVFASSDLHRAAALTALSNALRDRYVATGTMEDLDEAIAHAEEALELSPPHHPEHAARLTNLAVLLSDDFTERADRAHLDRAIMLYRDALSANEKVVRRIPERANDLALALRDRHKDTGNPDDLREAVELAESVLGASQRNALTWAGYANNLGNALNERYELDGTRVDLDRAIELFRAALAEAAQRPYEASGYATNLGLALATRALETGAMDDIDQALLIMGRAVDLLPVGHPDRAIRMANLADGYRQRSIMLETAGVLNFAWQDARTAVAIAKDAASIALGDARMLPSLANWALALRRQRQLEPAAVDPSEILALQRRAACLQQITPAERFGQTGRWAADAEAAGAQDEAMTAYERAVALTTQVAWAGLGLRERRALLAGMDQVRSRAVRFAALHGRPWTAAAWADHIRSVLWRQGLWDDPRARGRISPREESAGLGNREFLDSHRERPEPRRTPSSDRPDQWADPIRLGAEYRRLQFAGIIALLVPGDDQSLAVILRSGEEARVLPLPGTGSDELAEQVDLLTSAGDMFATDELRARHTIFDCLQWLWDRVAHPIVEDLCGDGDRPHVWWSPLGEFALLPIHAAGRHPRKETQMKRRVLRETVPDRVSSSYLPTIFASTSGASGPEGHLLYVSTDAEGTLDHLDDERAAVSAALTRVPMVERVGEDAAVEGVRAAIPACRFLHVAAHGADTDLDAVEAGFGLADGVLSLRELADCRAQGSLAVLLACNSAAGDRQSPNEALHAAGAAHQAGFPDVVAATLPVRDSSAVTVVSAIYRAVNADPSQVSSTVPIALEKAVSALRLDPASGPDPLAWVPYAHFRAGLGRSASAD